MDDNSRQHTVADQQGDELAGSRRQQLTARHGFCKAGVSEPRAYCVRGEGALFSRMRAMGIFSRFNRPGPSDSAEDKTHIAPGTPLGAPAASQHPIEELFEAGRALIGTLAEAHKGWGCGSAERWDLDQSTGLIEWTFPDRTATASAQILASYSRPEGTWMWGWANESILPTLRRDAQRVRDWALANGHPDLAEPILQADDRRAADLSALAVLVTQATGFYNPVRSAIVPIITFGAVTIKRADG